MNGPYMMLSPEIRKNGGLWDRIFFDSIQSKDVQVRFIHETQATYTAAKRVLDRGESVRIKAVAAGTGLSLILVYDKLIRDGYDPKSITAVITDRDPANTEKSNRLLGKLANHPEQPPRPWDFRRRRGCVRSAGPARTHPMMSSPPSAFWNISKVSPTGLPRNG